MEACTNPDVLKIIMYITQILKLIFFVVPIGLIVMLGLDFFKNVTASNENDMKKNVSVAIKRIVYCIFIFFVPFVVNFVNILLDDLGVGFAQCFTNANSEYIEDKIIENANAALTAAKENKTMKTVLEAEDAINKITDESTKSSLKSEIKVIKEQVLEEAENKKEQGDAESEISPGQGNGGSNDNDDDSSGSSGSTGFDDYGEGTENEYFAPIQGTTFGIGSYGDTPGCSNKVYHDLNGVAEGTPIYAGIDGTAQFMQTTSSAVVKGKTVLTSYGNQVKITGSDGTYIIYAHLQKFANGINAPITETCPKKGGSPPCSSTVYASSTSVSDTKQVKKGDLIGYVGNTGNSTGTHLHVEIHHRGSSYCVSNPWKAFGMQ